MTEKRYEKKNSYLLFNTCYTIMYVLFHATRVTISIFWVGALKKHHFQV